MARGSSHALGREGERQGRVLTLHVRRLQRQRECCALVGECPGSSLRSPLHLRQKTRGERGGQEHAECDDQPMEASRLVVREADKPPTPCHADWLASRNACSEGCSSSARPAVQSSAESSRTPR